MVEPTLHKPGARMKRIFAYVSCTFLLTYVSHGLLGYATATGSIRFSSLIGQSLFIIGGSSPTIFACIFVFGNKDKRVKHAFMQKLLSFKHPFPFWLFAMFLPVVLGGIFQLLYVLLSPYTFTNDIPFYFFVVSLFTSIIFGGLEEIGWRGFLQEQFMGKVNLVGLSVLIGIIWGLWHVPLFFVEEVSHYSSDFFPFLLGAIMFSTYLTWLYAKTNSIILVVIFHAAINASGTIGLGLLFENTLLTYGIITGFMIVGLLLLVKLEKS
jgi:uncharacterized protein